MRFTFDIRPSYSILSKPHRAMSTQQHFVLPDLLAVCPLKGSTNPHYLRAAAESTAWVKSYNTLSERKLAFLLQGSSELLVSHAYPYAPYDQFRACCDFVNLLFVVDEVSDDQNGCDARRTGEVFSHVMRYPDWDDGSALAKMTQESVPHVIDMSKICECCTDHVYVTVGSSSGSWHLPAPTAIAASSCTAMTTSTQWRAKLNTGNVARSSTLPRSRRYDGKTAPSGCALAYSNSPSALISRTGSSKISTS